MKGISLVDPSFADAQQGAPEDELHGVAVRMPLMDYATLSKQEGGYLVATVSILAYDGRALIGQIYSLPPEKVQPTDIPCSERYLNVLVSGAKEAGLKAEYIAALAARPFYTPSADTLAKRLAMCVSPATLPPITVAELQDYADQPRGTVRAFRQKFTFEDAIGSHACSLQANTRVTNGIPLGCLLLLPVNTVNCVQTLKGKA